MLYKGFQIDRNDLPRVKLFKWKISKYHGYVYCKSPFKRRHILLHRFIMGVDSFDKNNESSKSKIVVDHKNRNRLDNRKSNLKITSYMFNNWNKKLDKRNKTGYTGIYKTKYGTYRVSMTINGKHFNFPVYKKLEDALLLRRKAEDIRNKGKNKFIWNGKEY